MVLKSLGGLTNREVAKTHTLQADLTRVATLVLGTEGNRRSFLELGFTEEHHGVFHHGDSTGKLTQLTI